MARELDALVAGAGPVGCACALALERLGLRVGLISDRPLVAGGQRLYALNDASRRLLAGIGVWRRLEEPVAVTRMDITVSGEAGLNLRAWRAGLSQLCYTVEEADLLGALHRALAESGVEIEAPAELAGLQIGPDRVEAIAGGRSRSAGLVIGADGSASAVAGLAGLRSPFARLPYSAVVARLVLPRLGRAARQWMSPSGVLALLPGPGGRACVIWSLAEGRAERIGAAGDAAFIEELEAEAGELVHGWSSLGPRHRFPLSEGLRRAGAPRVALLGDAAHCFPPLAGQGLAVGFGDVAALRREVERAGCAGGAAAARYRRSRWLRSRITHSLTTMLTEAAGSGAGSRLLDCGLRLTPPALAARLANLP